MAYSPSRVLRRGLISWARGLNGRRTQEGGALARPGAAGLDRAAVVGIRCDSRSKAPGPVPWPARRRVKNGSKMRSRTSGSMPQPLSATLNSAMPSRDSKPISHPPVVLHAVQGVGQEIEHDLLEFLAVDRGRDRRAVGSNSICLP